MKSFQVYITRVKNNNNVILTILKETDMNRQEFVQKLLAYASSNDYSMSDIVVTHGGACLMMGLRQETGDIDVMVAHDIWVDSIKQNMAPVDLTGGVWLISATPDIDIHVGMDEGVHPIVVSPEGVHYHGLEQTLLDYQKLNRPKDQTVIAGLVVALENSAA